MTTMTITEARAVLADDSAGNDATAAALAVLCERDDRGTLYDTAGLLPEPTPLPADCICEPDDQVEAAGDLIADAAGRRQVVPVLFAVMAAWNAYAAGQQAGQQVYRPTATSAKAAAIEAQVLRRAVDDADPSDPFEGRVSAPAGTPRAAVPFVEEVAS